MHGLTLNMAFKVIFLAVLCMIATHCTAEQTQYSEALCTVLPVEDVASQFKLLAKDKKVRMIYLNLTMKISTGNDTYQTLRLTAKDEFLPWRWVWAKSISEPMLSLPYDYDILSLGLLNYQVRNITIQLQDYPSGCLAALNRSSGRDEVIGSALLKNVTKGGELQREGEVVCVAVVDTGIHDFFDGNVVFQCCERDNTVPEKMRCGQLIKKNSWLVAFTYVLNVLTIVLIFYCPALPLALPSCIFDLEEEIEKEKLQENGLQVPPDTESEYNSLDQNLLYLDDASPITCSTLLGKCGKYTKELSDFRLAFNFKLAFLWFCVIPFFFYIELGLNFTLKNQFLEELFSNNNAHLLGPLFTAFSSSLFWLLGLFLIWLIVLPFFPIMSLSPKDFLLWDDSLGMGLLRKMGNLKVKVFNLASTLIEYHSAGINKSVKCSMKPSVKLIGNPCKRLRRILFNGLWVFPCVVFVLIICGVVLGVIYIFVFLVMTGVFCLYYSPLVYLCFFLFQKLLQSYLIFFITLWKRYYFGKEAKAKCLLKLTFLVSVVPMAIFLGLPFVFLLLQLLTASFIASVSCRFIVKTIGFVIMGLVLNAEIVSPFVTFFVAVSTNLYLCYHNLQERYKEVKKMISNHWKQLRRLGRDTGVDLSSGRQDTIPEALFWHVCGEKSKSNHKVLPIMHEICYMLGKMTLIFIFSFLTLCSVILLRNSYRTIPSVAATVAVFVSGIIPKLFSKGSFSGAKKEEMMGEIELAVNEYVRLEGTGTDTSAVPVNRQDIELTEYETV